jgi:HEAT repeat protein
MAEQQPAAQKSQEEIAQEKGRRVKYALTIGAIAFVIAVLWYRYATTQRLIRALDSRSVAVRARAAGKLLTRGVLEDSLPAQPVNRRAKTAAALAMVGSKAALEQLVVLIKDPEDKPQEAAWRAFGTVPAKRGLRYLLPLYKEGDVRAKKAAVRGAALMGEPAIRGLARTLLGTDQDSKDRREQAANALGQMRKFALGVDARPAGFSKPSGPKVAEEATLPLLRAAQSDDKDLRKIAITVLGDVKEKRGVPFALKDLAEKGNRRAAIIALGLMRDPRATEALVPFLKDEVLAIDAVNALGNIADARAAAAILEKLKDPELQFRQAGVWALQRMGKSAVPVLVARLKSANVNQRRCAAEGMIGTNDPSSIPALQQALSDPDARVRTFAARALGWKGNTAAMQALVGALRDASWQVADAAGYSLASIGEAALPTLMAQFESPDVNAAYQASLAIARMPRLGYGSPGEALKRALGAADAASRKWSAVTLGNMQDATAEQPLRDYLRKAQTADEKWVAAEALRKLGVVVGG